MSTPIKTPNRPTRQEQDKAISEIKGNIDQIERVRLEVAEKKATCQITSLNNTLNVEVAKASATGVFGIVGTALSGPGGIVIAAAGGVISNAVGGHFTNTYKTEEEICKSIAEEEGERAISALNNKIQAQARQSSINLLDPRTMFATEMDTIRRTRLNEQKVCYAMNGVLERDLGTLPDLVGASSGTLAKLLELYGKIGKVGGGVFAGVGSFFKVGTTLYGNSRIEEVARCLINADKSFNAAETSYTKNAIRRGEDCTDKGIQGTRVYRKQTQDPGQDQIKVRKHLKNFIDCTKSDDNRALLNVLEESLKAINDTSVLERLLKEVPGNHASDGNQAVGQALNLIDSRLNQLKSKE